MEETIKIKGRFVFPVYDRDGFCVYKYRDIEKDRQVTLLGHNLPCNKTIKYEFTCKEVEKGKYGKELEVVSFKESVEKDKEAIVEYLTSGLFKGIGKKTAENIYAKFGNDTLEILNTKPEEILKVKGFGKNRLNAFLESYKASRVQAELYEYLTPFGISTSVIQKVIKRYPEKTLEHVKNNPYCLCSIRGVNFLMADKIASTEGINKDNYLRINAITVELLKTNYLNGDVYMDIEDFARGFVKLCNFPQITMSNWFNYIYGPITYDEKTKKYTKITPIKEPKGINPYAGPIQSGLIKRIKTDKVDAIYPINAYKAEQDLANAIARLSNGKTEKYDASQIEGYDTLDPSQQTAVTTSLTNPFSIITGGPGTGKTTIIKKIVSAWKKKHRSQEVVLLAPTGKAARRMAEACGIEASTIHSYLKLGLSDQEDNELEESIETINNSLVIVDETSMLDLWLARTLLKSIENSKVVFVGDIHQLPSVGAGAVLGDIIKSQTIPVSVLKYTHRQSEGSTICDNADKIRRGDPVLENAADFVIKEMTGNNTDDIRHRTEELMASFYSEEIEKYGMENVICLCPFKKYEAGTYSLNKNIQNKINPRAMYGVELYGRNGDIFREGDPVIQLKNVCEEDGTRLSNGDIGKVTSIVTDGTDTQMTVLFDNGKTKTYTKSETEDLTLAYAITVHKSQGSEYDSVIICLLNGHSVMLYRKLIYTAITRGAKKVTLITQKDALFKAVTNAIEKPRKTGLKKAIEDNFKILSVSATKDA